MPDSDLKLLCESNECLKCKLPLSTRDEVIIKMHEAFIFTIKSAPRCSEIPYPLHEGTKHSYICDSVVEAAIELIESFINKK